jgi:hypothetical protein
MKRFLIPTLFVILTLLISGCGGQPAPTAAPIDFEGTVAAAAFTVIAETQEALPTATPIPPTATFTETSLPTLTSIPLPSAEVTTTPASSGNAGGSDPCVNKTLPNTLQGNPIRIRLNNSTKAKLSVTVYLNQTVPQSVCGYRSYTIDPQQSLVLNDLVEGCYTIWAWNPDPDTYFIATNGTNCLDVSDSWVFDISTSTIKLDY